MNLKKLKKNHKKQHYCEMSDNNVCNTCQVCTEKLNKSIRSIIKCKCDYICCKSCAKIYLLSSKNNAHCMNCKIEWNREFMVINFDKNFINKTYKKHRENVLFEREIALLPATQPHVELRKKVNEKTARLNFLIKETQQLRDEINIVMNNNSKNIIDDKYKSFDYYLNQMTENENEIENLYQELDELKSNGVNEKVVKEFIRQCPNNNCKGFLSKNLYCELCHIHACSDCHEIKDTTHVCNPEIVENIKSMKNNTKPCPKCSALIFKIDGCDQIFCVKCHTAFSWKTLKIETGVIHNPHYFEWIRSQNNGQMPRNPLDIPCGREINAQFASDIYMNIDKIFPGMADCIYNICLKITHIREVDKPKYYVNPENVNLDLRIDYMLNNIDQLKFKMDLQKREKKNNKKTEIYNILDMFITCVTDILYRLNQKVIQDNSFIKNYIKNLLIEHNINCTTILSSDIKKILKGSNFQKIIYKSDIQQIISDIYTTYDNIIAEIKQLKNYTNEQLKKLATIYNSKYLQLNNEFYLK